MFCHAIIGTSTGKERIMKVDISAEFISPLLSFSQREINFCVMKVCGKILKICKYGLPSKKRTVAQYRHTPLMVAFTQALLGESYFQPTVHTNDWKISRLLFCL